MRKRGPAEPDIRVVEGEEGAQAPAGASAQPQAPSSAAGASPSGGAGAHWQARAKGPVVTEDDEWAGGPRLAKGEIARLARRLSRRDRVLLALLGEHGYLTTEDVETLLFPSPRTARLRLRQLRPTIAKRRRSGTRISNEDGLGLLMRWSRVDPGGGSWRRIPAAFLLRQKGALVLAALRRLDAEATKRLVIRTYNKAEFTSQLDHDLGAIAFFTALGRASRDVPDQGLYGWTGEAALRSRFKERQGDLAPDGWGRYLTADREVQFLLEWDAGTEPPSTLTAKAEGYGAFANGVDEAEGRRNHILWVADRERRERTIRDAIDRARPDARYVQHWTTTAARLEQDGSLAAVWQHIGAEMLTALPELAGEPRSDRPVEECLGKPGWWERAELPALDV